MSSSFEIRLSYGAVAVMTPEFAAGDKLVGFTITWKDGSPMSDKIRRNLFGCAIAGNTFTMTIFPEREGEYVKVASGALLPKVILGKTNARSQCTLEAIEITMEPRSLPTAATIRAYFVKGGVREPRFEDIDVSRILSRINVADLF